MLQSTIAFLVCVKTIVQKFNIPFDSSSWNIIVGVMFVQFVQSDSATPGDERSGADPSLFESETSGEARR